MHSLGVAVNVSCRGPGSFLRRLKNLFCSSALQNGSAARHRYLFARGLGLLGRAVTAPAQAQPQAIAFPMRKGVLSRRWLNCSGPAISGLSVAGDRLTARIQPLLDGSRIVAFEELGAGHAGLARLRSASETTVGSPNARSTQKEQTECAGHPATETSEKTFVCHCTRLREPHSPSRVFS